MLDFSDPSFSQFFAAELDVDIDDPIYAEHGGSKGKRLRRFLQKVDDASAVRTLQALWKHRTELLARTGQQDPVLNAEGRYLNDESTMHFGLIPRSHRCLFVINELPDLQARIQVSLFNVLQEGDMQIRGFKLRLPLDVQFVFTANPEDYTNRGSIITPLKDQIGRAHV